MAGSKRKMRVSEELGLEYWCSKCEEFYPADREFFYKDGNKSGLHLWCKPCLEADPKHIMNKKRWAELLKERVKNKNRVVN